MEDSGNDQNKELEVGFYWVLVDDEWTVVQVVSANRVYFMGDSMSIHPETLQRHFKVGNRIEDPPAGEC